MNKWMDSHLYWVQTLSSNVIKIDLQHYQPQKLGRYKMIKSKRYKCWTTSLILHCRYLQCMAINCLKMLSHAVFASSTTCCKINVILAFVGVCCEGGSALRVRTWLGPYSLVKSKSASTHHLSLSHSLSHLTSYPQQHAVTHITSDIQHHINRVNNRHFGERMFQSK